MGVGPSTFHVVGVAITDSILANCLHPVCMQGPRGGVGGMYWIPDSTQKRKWVVENLLWMGEMKQDREGYLMKIMRYLVKLDDISDMLMKFFHFELPCV